MLDALRDFWTALLAVPHVASAQTAQATTESMRASLDEFVGILQIAALVTLLLALFSIGIGAGSDRKAVMVVRRSPPTSPVAAARQAH